MSGTILFLHQGLALAGAVILLVAHPLLRGEAQTTRWLLLFLALLLINGLVMVWAINTGIPLWLANLHHLMSVAILLSAIQLVFNRHAEAA